MENGKLFRTTLRTGHYSTLVNDSGQWNIQNTEFKITFITYAQFCWLYFVAQMFCQLFWSSKVHDCINTISRVCFSQSERWIYDMYDIFLNQFLLVRVEVNQTHSHLADEEKNSANRSKSFCFTNTVDLVKRTVF